MNIFFKLLLFLKAFFFMPEMICCKQYICKRCVCLFIIAKPPVFEQFIESAHTRIKVYIYFLIQLCEP